MWKCPKCNREFKNTNQPHSCKSFPVSEHFKGKESSKALYDKLLTVVKKSIGPFKVESLPCCIHIVDDRSKITYFCAYALKDGIKLHLASDKVLKGSKVSKGTKIGRNYKYEVFIKSESDIDKELLNWLKASNKTGL